MILNHRLRTGWTEALEIENEKGVRKGKSGIQYPSLCPDAVLVSSQ